MKSQGASLVGDPAYSSECFSTAGMLTKNIDCWGSSQTNCDWESQAKDLETYILSSFLITDGPNPWGNSNPIPFENTLYYIKLGKRS